jgi:hypothetical protein
MELGVKPVPRDVIAQARVIRARQLYKDEAEKMLVLGRLEEITRDMRAARGWTAVA